MKESIIFDLDDVLIMDAFFGVLKKFCNEKLGKDVFKEDLGKNYYYEEDVFESKENKEAFFDYFLKQDMYDYGEVEEGVIELLKELTKTHNVFIFTAAILKSRPRDSAILLKNKYEALCRLFPFIPPENFIIGGNKSIASAKYMVDDKIDNLTGNIDVKMLYSARHNLNITDKELCEKGIIRVSSMEEIRKIIYKDFTLEKVLKIVNRYLPYFVQPELIICTKVQGNLDISGEKDFKIITKISNNSSNSCCYNDDNRKKLDEFQKFISKIIGRCNVVFEK